MADDNKLKKNQPPQYIERSAAIFLNSLSVGHTTSFSANQLPLAILDKSLSGKVDPTKSIISVQRDDWEITYKAAAIADKDKKVSHYFATNSAMLILDTIWDLVSLNKCHLKQRDNTFSVMFRKQDVRNHLEEHGKSRSGKQINQQLEILQGAILEVRNNSRTGSGAKGSPRSDVKLSGTYLQSAYEIESDDPKLDGLYMATLHPIIAEDLMLGRFRDVEKTFLLGASESNELYKTLIHLMRHQFTNADATSECVSFGLWMNDILFSAGKVEAMTQAAMRKAINTLRAKLVDKNVISNRDCVESKWEMDGGRGVQDYRLTITPTTLWGESQRKSNAKHKRQMELLASSEDVLIEEFEIEPTEKTVITKLS
ncbi:hypothetical protein [Photobacterium kishitanii]|uniref:Replication protein n=1 Tax=Photobacterium kishitanii TaxID=318456 RepID=A0A2T3KLF5_9GAMM|nr:hypothetical protein [Photobacterium kishitanii]PSV00521.1 hypothetical protein C9J27_05145 [Photobacterium kishitanii]